jgi:hypothetical protein
MSTAEAVMRKRTVKKTQPKVAEKSLGVPLQSCFVISQIGEPDSSSRKHADTVLEKIIEPALQAHGFDPKRIDQRNTNPGGPIPEEVVRALMESPLCVADLSDLNPNVMFELGIRHAWDLPVLHLAHQSTKLPFDVTHRGTIFYSLDSERSISAAVRELSKQCEVLVKNLASRKDGEIPIFCEPFAKAMQTLGRRYALDAVFDGKIAAMVTVIDDFVQIKADIHEDYEQDAPGKPLQQFVEKVVQVARDLSTRTNAFEKLAKTQQRAENARKHCDTLLGSMKELQREMDGLVLFLENAGSTRREYDRAEKMIGRIVQKAEVIKENCARRKR